MIKKTLITICITCSVSIGFSQSTNNEDDLKTVSMDTIEGWKYVGTIAINLSQVSLTNWSAGGQNTISTNGLLSIFANYKKGKNTWENYLDFGYGTIKQGRNANWWKTDDKIDFTSKYGQKAFSNWYYAGLLNFKTQMTAGYNYPNDSTKISTLLAPGYLIGAIGMDYKPSDNFTAFIAPLTAKVTVVGDQTLADAGAFGVEPATFDTAGNVMTAGENIRNEFGGYIRLFYKKDLMENIGLQTKLDLFSNYLNKPQNIDINWEVLVSMKVNKYISATLSTQLIYDHDIDIAIDSNGDNLPDKMGPRIQFKEVLAAGFSYKF